MDVRKYVDNYPFPEVVGANHIPEGIVWSQLDHKYRKWYSNEVVRIYYVGEGGNLMAKRTKRSQFASQAFNLKWNIMHEEWPWCRKPSFKLFLEYSVCYSIAWKKYRKHNKYLDGIKKHRIPLILLYPLGFWGSVLYRIRHKIK